MGTTYYDQHARDFFSRTVALDVSHLHARFLAHLSPRAHILDAGCGSGRDAKAFLEQGFPVTAFDASSEMVQRASQYLGQPVLQLEFVQLDFVEQFDGIWSCASLLHVPQIELPGVLSRLARALKPRGVWYMSFKLGQGERMQADRLFNDQNEASLTALLAQLPNLHIIELWSSPAQGPNAPSTQWLHCLVRKNSTAK